VHLYGKEDIRLGRKMGHLTALAPSADSAVERVLDARKRLSKQ
jgi:5-(carboxyamino)imidazole ribonucleotide synthase